MKENAHFRPKSIWLLVVILLVAAALRWQNLSAMHDMLGVDEAYNAQDAALLLDDFRLTPFLPDNNGRESAYHYWVIPFLGAVGRIPLALRLASTTLGILSIAALYPLGKQLFDRRVALWACAVLSVFFWHMHMSQLGLRAILQPLVGTLALAALWQAQHRNRPRDWIIGGILTGSLIYTYFSARLWIILIGLWLLLIIWRMATRRMYALLAGIIASVMMLPQLAYTYLNPTESLGRMQSVATVDLNSITTNIVIWGRAWFQAGDDNTFLNLTNRPVFDLPLGMLCVIGLVMLLANRKTHQQLIWLGGVFVFALLPSLLSEDAPHFLRAIGATIPLALLGGYGAAGVEQMLRRWRVGVPLVIVLLAWAAVGVVRDQQRWLSRDDRFIMMEMAVNGASGWVDDNVSDLNSVYYSPYNPFHPNVGFQGLRLRAAGAEHIGAFSPAICVIVPDKPAIYANAPIYLPRFAELMSPWSQLTPLHIADTIIVDDVPLFELYRGESRLNELLVSAENPPTFINALELRHTPLPATVRAGDTMPLALAFRATSQLPAVYSAFVHLHGDPSPYDGGVTWAQADSWLCEPYQAPQWRPHETIVQTLNLPIPADTPPGRYAVAVGVYESPAGSRIELTYPGGNPHQFVTIGTIEVE